MKVCWRPIVLLFVITVCLTVYFTGQKALAQTRGVKPLTMPQQPDYQEPAFQAEQEKVLNDTQPLQDNKSVLPKLKSDTNSSSLQQQTRFFLSQIILKGNTLIDQATLRRICQPYLGQFISMEQLQAIRQQLSMQYFSQGYINSGVVIPDQKINQGMITLQVIEGGLQSIAIKGNQSLHTSYVEKRIQRGAQQPLNRYRLQEALARLQRSRLIDRLSAQLHPGRSPGQATLDITVQEAPPQQLIVSIDNHQSPNVGAEKVTLFYEHANLSGRGDALSLTLRRSEGVSGGHISYNVPLSAADTGLFVHYQTADAELIAESLQQAGIDIESTSFSYHVGLTQPWYLDINTTLDVNISLQHKQSESFLEGELFAFSQNQNTETTAIQLGGGLVKRSPTQVIVGNLSLRQGIDSLGAKQSDFTVFTGQLQFARRFALLRGSQWLVKSAWQYTEDTLPAIEKFAIGGVNTVRGLRENLLVRDNALTASLEWRLPLIKSHTLAQRNPLQLSLFTDWGKAWDNNSGVLSNNDKATLLTTGLGVLWQPYQGLSAELFWGDIRRNDNPITQDDNLQDDGVHFSLRYSYRY